mgnify:FL=1
MADTKNADLLKASDDRYKASVDGWQHIYTAALDDLRFVYDIDSGQWNAKIRNERNNDERPIITVNKLLKFIRQLRGDMALNRPRTKVIPVDNKADVQMAKLYDGIIREIEYLSSANIAYDTAYMHAISCSVGYFRLITEYENDRSFNQSIKIKRILNPFSVHPDPAASEFTLSDANYYFIEENLLKEDFKKQYPSADIVDFSGDNTGMEYSDWFSEDKVRVAEYFYKEPTKKKIAQIQTGETVELTKDLTLEKLYSMGQVVVKEREVKSHKVMWCKRSGSEVLEGPQLWPGKYIPIIPVFGDEVVVNGKKHLLSLARGAKGPQEMYNYWATAATENVALSPKSPFIVDHRQVKGFETEWEDSRKTNRMFLRYNAIAGLQKPAREPQTVIPAAIINMMQVTAFDIEDHLGRYESSKGEAGNERSGKAILARVAQSDKGTFTFLDNLTRAIVYSGRQLIDIIPKIYDTHRALRILGEKGNEQVVEVNAPVVTPSGEVGIANDLTVGEFDIISTVGLAFGSKREEMVRYMTESMQYAPQIAHIIAPLIYKYSDWPGAEEIYNEIKAEIDQMKKQQKIQGEGVAPPALQ